MAYRPNSSVSISLGSSTTLMVCKTNNRQVLIHISLTTAPLCSARPRICMSLYTGAHLIEEQLRLVLSIDSAPQEQSQDEFTGGHVKRHVEGILDNSLLSSGQLGELVALQVMGSRWQS